MNQMTFGGTNNAFTYVEPYLSHSAISLASAAARPHNYCAFPGNTGPYLASSFGQTTITALVQPSVSLNLYVSILTEVILIKTSNTLNGSLPTDSWPRSPLPLLRDFVLQLILISQSLPITLLIVLVLLDRLRMSLPYYAVGTNETGHRVFLAALIVANKFLLDIPVKNSVWSQWTNNYYSIVDINCMERQFLNLLHHDIEVSLNEVQQQLCLVQRLHYHPHQQNRFNDHKRNITPKHSHHTMSYPQFAPPLCPCSAYTGEKKRVHCNLCSGGSSAPSTTVASAFIPIHPLPFQLKRQKGQFEDNFYSLHNIPSPCPSLERSPIHFVYPQSAYRSSSLSSNWIASQPASFSQSISFV